MNATMHVVSRWLIALAVLAVSGCDSGSCGSKSGKATPAAESSCAVGVNWCGEHGVPEDVCGLCNAKVAAECKRKGDWCKEHNRPESQCFLCNPGLQAKFAAEYEAKNGTKPPR